MTTAPQRAVSAERSGSGEHEEQEHEAVKNGRVPAVQHRVEISRGVKHPVCDCHLAREDKRHWPSEKAEDDEDAADEFEDGPHAKKGRQWG